MGLIKYNFNKVGPGVEKNTPRKKGLLRFLEVCIRDFGNLVKLNLMVIMCYFPSIVLFGVSLFYSQYFMILLILSIAAAVPVGGATTAGYFILAKMLRDDPGYVRDDFNRKFKENFHSTLLTGVIFTFVTYMQIIFVILFLRQPVKQINMPALLAILLSVLSMGIFSPFYFLQAGYLELNVLELLKNSVLLSLNHIVRSFMGALFTAIAWVIGLIFFPLSLPLLLLGLFSLSWLINLMWIWPPVNEQFNIEKTLKQSCEEDEDNT